MSENEKPLAFVIEDDPEQQKIFSYAIKEAGYTVEVIGNGTDAMQRLNEATPALVILDLHLPVISGDEILRYIRTDERLTAISVILATADPLLAESLSAESDLVLLKPISFIQLRDLATRLRSVA